MDMFIGFLGFTNDAVMENAVNADISMLDESALNALDIPKINKKDIQTSEFSSLELLVEEQKQKRKISNSNMIRRLSATNDISLIDGQKQGEDLLNESYPEIFHISKDQDRLNESRPKQKE